MHEPHVTIRVENYLGSHSEMVEVPLSVDPSDTLGEIIEQAVKHGKSKWVDGKEVQTLDAQRGEYLIVRLEALQ